MIKAKERSRYAFVILATGLMAAFIFLQTIGNQSCHPLETRPCNDQPTTVHQHQDTIINSQMEYLLRDVIQKLEALEQAGQKHQCNVELSTEFQALRKSVEALIPMKQQIRAASDTITRIETASASSENEGERGEEESKMATIGILPQQSTEGTSSADGAHKQPAVGTSKNDTATQAILQRIGGTFERNTFYPQLSIQDYAFLPHARPSPKWLKACATTIAKDDAIVKPFPVLRVNYALGDCIKLCNTRCSSPQGHQNHTATNVGEPYWATMAGYYGHIHCQGQDYFHTNRTALEALWSNITNAVTELFQIFGSRPGFRKPDPDAFVIHLRLGDVMESPKKRKRRKKQTKHTTAADPPEYRPDTLLQHGGSANHGGFKNVHTIFSVDEYLNVIDTYAGSPNAKVILVGGSHLPDMYQNSRVYATCLARGLAMAGKHVELQTDNGDPDQDFYFMSNARLFMRSTGGYSRLIGDMVKVTGGQVLHWNNDIQKVVQQ